MASSPAPSLLAPCAALALLLLAAPARADFDECPPLMSTVPGYVLDTIVGPASFGFGNSTPKTCDAIVEKAVSGCKAQVKIADQCYRRAFDTNYAIALKQCEQLEEPSERRDCKAEYKSIRDAGKEQSRESKNDTFAMCEGDFATTLETLCLSGPPM